MCSSHANAAPSQRGPLSLCVLLALLAWAPSIFSAGFSYDDREAIFENPAVAGALPLSAAFERDYWHHRGDAGHYRPLATASLRLDHSLWGSDARGYHATNVLLHVAVVLLLGLWFIRRLPHAVPWLGIAIFAAHPVLADSVAWISGRTSMLSALGGLIGAVLLTRSKSSQAALLAATLGLLLALLGKEDGIVFGLAYLVSAKKRRGAILVGCVLAVCAYAALRANALGSAFPSAPGAPLAATPLLERVRIGGFAILEGLRLTVFPFRYPPHYRVQDLAPDAGMGSWIAATCAWLALGSLLIRPIWRRDRVAISGALAATIALPVLQLVPAGEVFAPRFLYPVLLFAVPFLGGALRCVLPKPGARALVFGLLLSTSLLAAWMRSNVYESRGSYRRAVLSLHADDARSWNGLGHDYYERGRIIEARAAWERAVEIEPGYSRPWTNLGISYFTQGEPRLALPYFAEAVETGPQNPIAHVWLGRARLGRSQLQEAGALFERAAAIAPGMSEAWVGLAQVHLELEELPEARHAIERARQLAPTSREVLETWARIVGTNN